MKFSEEQQKAIAANGAYLTVRAGAGAGKTSVLVERYLRHIREESATPDDILTITYTRRAAADMKRRIVEALRQSGRPDLASQAEIGPISTIHGYCERLLKEYPFSIGIDPKFSVMDDSSNMIEECARRALSADDICDVELPYIQSCAGERIAGEPRRDVAAKIIHQINLVLDKFRTAGKTSADLWRFADSPERIQATWRQYEDAAAREVLGTEYHADWRGQRSKNSRKWMTTRFDQDEDFAAAALTAGLASLSARTWDLLTAEFDRRKCFDYTELEARACKLLETDAEVLRGRYKWIIVDEAQDINPVQYRILEATPTESRLLVGDPRQAIYAFRGASRELFVNSIGRSNCSTLLTNWRSTSSILDAVQSIFEDIWPEDNVRMHCGKEGTPGPKVEVWRVGLRPHDAMTEGLRQIISEGCPPKDIAVLVRNATKVEDLTAKLRTLGHKVASPGTGKKYFVRGEIRDLGSALQALSDPSDDLALLSTLRSPLVGIPLDDCIALGLAARNSRAPVYSVIPNHSFSDDARTRITEFLGWFEQLSTRVDRMSAWEVLAEVYAAVDLDARFAMTKDKEQLVANSRKLLTIAMDQRNVGAGEFGDWLSKQAEMFGGSVPDADTLSPESTAIRISTMHRAKGLEWDTVIVQTTEMKDPDKQKDVVVDPVAGILGVRGEYIPHALSAANARQLEAEAAEELRLLYVAATRAKTKLCIVTMASGAGKCFAAIKNGLAKRGDIVIRDLKSTPQEQNDPRTTTPPQPRP
jgi:ATP-dependent exoDNAse (exonuclease V) beta subunit